MQKFKHTGHHMKLTIGDKIGFIMRSTGKYETFIITGWELHPQDRSSAYYKALSTDADDKSIYPMDIKGIDQAIARGSVQIIKNALKKLQERYDKEA